MIKIGVTGFRGHVGQELLKFPNTVPLPCDVRNLEEIERSVGDMRPDVIVHLASISDVERCEDKANQKIVDDVNVRGAFNVAEVAERAGCNVVILSTSHVFDGKWGDYKENSRPNPRNYYGFSKLAAEGFRSLFSNVKIVRTSYLFDHDRLFRHIYPLRAKQSFEYPDFITRSFIYLPHFVESLYSYLKRFDDMPNMLHISGHRSASWYHFIQDVAKVFGLDTRLVCSRNYEIEGEFAPRPFLGDLNVNKSKQLGLPQFDYMDGLVELRDISI